MTTIFQTKAVRHGLPDPTQPGYGNFCFGHFEVISVDGYTPAANTNGTQYSVTYHYSVTGLPDWANSAEIKTAFPKIGSDASGQQIATANLAKSDNGWQVQNAQPVTPRTIAAGAPSFG